MRTPMKRSVVVIGLIATMALAGCTQKNNGATGSEGTGGNAGGKHQIAFVPKLQGIPYFEAMNVGGKKAEQNLGDVSWLYQGPTQADAAAQTQIVRSFIQRGVSVIVVAPNDPDSMAPVLKEAQAKGIKVMTSDTDAPNSVRDVFVSQASTEKIGEALTDNLMKAMGGKGKYAIVSCGETAQNLNSWIAVQKKYTAEKYPQAQIVDTVYAGEDQAKATQMAADLLNAHPDLTGLVGECTSSAPGVAQAVKDANKIGKVSTVGLGTPKAMQPYLTDGSSSASILWDVEQLGYLTAWAGDQLAAGKPLNGVNHVSDKLPAVKWDAASKTLVLGDPLVLTKDNAGQYNY